MIRAATLGDVPLIFATFVRCLRESRMEHKSATGYCERIHAEMETTLAAPGTVAVVSCDADDPDVAFGWAVGRSEPPTVTFVYVKGRLHHIGIGRELVRAIVDPALPFRATYITPVARAILARHPAMRVTLPTKSKATQARKVEHGNRQADTRGSPVAGPSTGPDAGTTSSR